MDTKVITAARYLSENEGRPLNFKPFFVRILF